MGMFDSVFAACPKCGSRHEVQSKTGDCVLAWYEHESVPTEVARGVDGDRFDCCATVWELEVPPTPRVSILIKRATDP